MPAFHCSHSYCGSYVIWSAVRWAAIAVFAASFASAQSVGNSGSLNGTVLDQTGAVVARAKVEVRNPVSDGKHRE